MIAAGHPNKTIASVLNISSGTVGTHLRRIFAKLGVKSRAAMVGRLHEFGIAARPTAARAEDMEGAAQPTTITEDRLHRLRRDAIRERA